MSAESNIIQRFLNHNEKTYKVLAIQYTEEQKTCMDNINVDDDLPPYDHYGKYSELIGLSDYVRKIGNNTDKNINTLVEIIQMLSHFVGESSNMSHSWLTIRVTNPSDDFDIPRWHTDGYFFTQPEDKLQSQYKFATVLQGPGTLFCKTDPETREKFFSLLNTQRNTQFEAESRIEGKKLLESSQNTKFRQLKKYEGVLFFVGDYKLKAIHSEPPMSTKRIFVSIVPGTEKQIMQREKSIKEFALKRKMEMEKLIK